VRFGARKRCFGGFLGYEVEAVQPPPIPGLTAPLWTAGFRGVSAVVGACVVRLLVEFAPRTSSTPVTTWCWQMESRSVERVILGVRPSGFILSEFQSPSRRIFIGSHSLPPLWLPNRSFKWYQSRFGSLLTLTSLRPKDGVPRTGFGSSTL
jgi:hypothetical protein